MRYLYQLGPWRASLFTTAVAPVSFAHDLTFRATESVLSFTDGAFSHADPVRPVAAQGNSTMGGTLICGIDGCANTQGRINEILSVAGKPYLPIIAYETWTSCANVGCRGCNKCQGRPQRGQFLLTYGTVMSMTRLTQIDLEQFSQEEFAAFNIAFTHYPIWEPVDRIRYRWFARNKAPWATMETYNKDTITRGPQPPFIKIDELTYPHLPDRGFQKVRFDGDMLVNPFIEPETVVQAYGIPEDLNDNWTGNEIVPAYVPPYDSVRGDYWTEIGDPVTLDLQVPTQYWPASPKSLYYFENMDSTGVITIDVTGITPEGTPFSNSTELQCALLEAALVDSGYPALQATDRIIIGTTSRGGGYLYRLGNDGLEFVDIYIPLVYSGRYPGEVGPGPNTIRVGGASGMLFAQTHIYRTF